MPPSRRRRVLWRRNPTIPATDRHPSGKVRQLAHAVANGPSIGTISVSATADTTIRLQHSSQKAGCATARRVWAARAMSFPMGPRPLTQWNEELSDVVESPFLWPSRDGTPGSELHGSGRPRCLSRNRRFVDSFPLHRGSFSHTNPLLLRRDEVMATPVLLPAALIFLKTDW